MKKSPKNPFKLSKSHIVFLQDENIFFLRDFFFEVIRLLALGAAAFVEAFEQYKWMKKN